MREFTAIPPTPDGVVTVAAVGPETYVIEHAATAGRGRP